MTEPSYEADRSPQEAMMMTRIESLERRVAVLEELERKREREWDAAGEQWLRVVEGMADGLENMCRWGG
jgi:hypothetical protein